MNRIPEIRAVLLLAAVCLAGAACTTGNNVEIPLVAQQLPARAPDATVEIHWMPDSLEGWLRLPVNEEKAPDLDAAHILDSHALWENTATARAHSKVADLVVSGQLHKKRPREWLLLDLAEAAREVGADAVVVNSHRVVGLSGHQARDNDEALWKTGVTVKVYLYAQAIRYE